VTYDRSVAFSGYSTNRTANNNVDISFSAHDGYSRNVPNDGYSRNVPKDGYSRNVPKDGYSRNASCALNEISTLLFAVLLVEYPEKATDLS